jgi:hypothetical protein
LISTANSIIIGCWQENTVRSEKNFRTEEI